MDDYTVIGDPHAKPNNLNILEELFDKVEALGNRTIWLGDLLDTKEVIRGKCLNAWFNYLKNSPLQHTILVGNHDWFNLECREHSLEVLKTLPNVNIVDSPQHTPGALGFLPYIHEEKELKKQIKLMQKDSVKIIFGHLELKGFDFGNGYICEEGLTERSFKDFQLIISGHFHKHQKKKNVVYLGTPFSHSFGESNQDKYIGILKSKEELTLELVPTNLPRHITYTVDVLEELPTNLKFGSRNFYRIILTGPRDLSLIHI